MKPFLINQNNTKKINLKKLSEVKKGQKYFHLNYFLHANEVIISNSCFDVMKNVKWHLQ